jgi:hypothetical protein
MCPGNTVTKEAVCRLKLEVVLSAGNVEPNCIRLVLNIQKIK